MLPIVPLPAIIQSHKGRRHVSVGPDQNYLIFGSGLDAAIITCDTDGNGMRLWESLQDFDRCQEQLLVFASSLPFISEEMVLTTSKHNSKTSTGDGYYSRINEILRSIADETRRERGIFDCSLDDSMVPDIFGLTGIDFPVLDFPVLEEEEEATDVYSNLLIDHASVAIIERVPVRCSVGSTHKAHSLLKTKIKNCSREQNRRKCIKTLIDEFGALLPLPLDARSKAESLNACSVLLLEMKGIHDCIASLSNITTRPNCCSN